MRRLILLRHAKSDWADPARGDKARPLAERGRASAPVIGRWLVSEGHVPDYVICSGAVRTRETWAIVKRELPAEPPVQFEDRIYEASPRQVLDVIRQAPVDSFTLLVIGHNPGLEELAAIIMGGGDPAARQRMAGKFPTAAAAVFDLDDTPWAELSRGDAYLAAFVTPKFLGIEGA